VRGTVPGFQVLADGDLIAIGVADAAITHTVVPEFRFGWDM